MPTVNVCRHVSAATLLLFSLALAGCNDSGRLPLKGSVAFEGEPIQNGYVQFRPLAGTTGPTSGADVKDGSYELDAVRGLFKGSYRVDIQAWKRSGGISIDRVTGEKTKGGDLKQILPAKYNKDSELTIDVGGDQTEFNFDLTR